MRVGIVEDHAVVFQRIDIRRRRQNCAAGGVEERGAVHAVIVGDDDEQVARRRADIQHERQHQRETTEPAEQRLKAWENQAVEFHSHSWQTAGGGMPSVSVLETVGNWLGHGGVLGGRRFGEVHLGSVCLALAAVQRLLRLVISAATRAAQSLFENLGLEFRV